MATRTEFTDAQSAVTGLQADGVIKERIDFSKYGGMASGDVVQLINIPAGMLVKDVSLLLVTLEGATCTGTVGDAVDPNGYITSADLDATVGDILATDGTHTGMTAYVITSPHMGGVRYTAADTIDITLSNAASTAVFDIIIEYTHIRDTSE